MSETPDNSPLTLLRRAVGNREARIVALFSFLQLLVAIAGNRVLTGLVPPSILGEYYLYINLALWLSLPSSSLSVYVMRHWSLAQTCDATPMLLRRMGWTVAAQACFALAGTAILATAGLVVWTLLPLLMIIPAAGAIQQLHGQIPSLERRRIAAGCLALAGSSRPWVLAAAAAFAEVSAQSLMILHLVGACLECILILPLIRTPRPQGSREAPPSPRPKELGLRSALSFALPYAITAVFIQAAASAERWGLADKAGTMATAMFVQAIGICSAAASVVSLPLNSYFFPIVAQAVASGNDPWLRSRRVITTCVLTSSVAFISAGAGLSLLAAPLTRGLLGPDYLPVAQLLPWAAAGACLFGLGQSLTVVSFARRDAWGPNVVFWIAKTGYILLLLLMAQSGGDSARQFCVIFAATNLVYALLMSLWASHLWRSSYSDQTPGHPALP